MISILVGQDGVPIFKKGRISVRDDAPLARPAAEDVHVELRRVEETGGFETYLFVTLLGLVEGAQKYRVWVVGRSGGGVVEATIGGEQEALRVPGEGPWEVRIRAEGDGHLGLTAEVGYGEDPVPDIEVVSAPVLLGERVEDIFVLIPGEFNVPPTEVVSVLQVSEDDAAWADYGSAPPTIPEDGVGKYFSYWQEITGPNGNVIYVRSNSIGPIEALPDIPDLEQIVAEDVTITGSYYRCGGDFWFAPIMQLAPWLQGVRVRWTTSNPEMFPNDSSGIEWLGYVEPIPGMPGYYSNFMADPEVHCQFGPPLQDRAMFRADHPLPRGRLRLAYQPLTSDPELDPWSPVSLPAWFVPEPEAPPIDPDVLEWRQQLFRSPGMFGVTPNAPHLYPHGFMGTDQMQWFPGVAQWSANGDKVLVGQDANQLMLSLDQGRSWFRPRAAGLPVNGVSSIMWDSTNNNRVLVLAGPTPSQYSTKGTEGGIFESNDNCETFTRVLAITNGAPGRFDWASNNFTRVGSTWWLIANRYNGSADGDLAFCRSTNNGNGWEIVNQPARSTFGRVRQLEVDRNNASRLFMASSTGLWRSLTAGATTGSWARNWYTGLPANTDIAAFWLDPDDSNHMLVLVRSDNAANRGLWETTNGTHFTRIRNVNGQHLSVSAKDGAGNRTIYLQPRGGPTGDNTIHVRLKNGNWVTRFAGSPPLTVNFRGLQSDWWPAQGMTFAGGNGTSGGSQQHTWISAHPTNPDLALGHFVTTLMLTENGGAHWALEGAGFGGLNIRGAWYLPEEPDIIVETAHDTGLIRSTNGRDTTHLISFGSGNFKHRAETVIGGNISSFRGRGIFILPNDSRLPPEWRRRIVFAASGTATANGVLGYVNWGSNLIQDWMGANPTQGQSNAQGGGASHRTSCGYMLDDPRKMWHGQNRINLAAGPNWSVVQGGRFVFGAAQNGTDTLYAFESGKTATILRSENFGTSWTPLHTFGANIIGQINPGVALGTWASLYDGRRMYLRPGVRTLAVLFDDGGTPQVTTFNLNSLFSGLSPMPVDATIVAVAEDSLDPRWIYLLTGAIGYGRKSWRGKFIAARTAIDWEDISANGPHNSVGGDVFTNLTSGDVLFNFDGIGAYWWPAPEDWQPRVGAFRFSGQPANGNTLTVNGQTVTFVNSGATGLQVNIGGNLATTLANLASVLNGSGNGNITPCTYRVDGNRLDVTMDSPRVGVEEVFALGAEGTANATVAHVAKPYKRKYWLRMPRIGS